MYKPIPLVQSQIDGDDSECESMLVLDEFDKHVSNEYVGTEEPPEHIDEKPPEMSTARKIAFIMSVLNCVAFIVIFVWVLPCNYNSCQAPSLSMKQEKEWQLNFEDQGTWLLQVAPAPSLKTKEIVLVTNSKLFSNMQNVSSLCIIGNSSDLIGIRAIDGKELWRHNATESFHYLNCSIADLNKDGASDCLMFDQSNGLRSFDTQTGSLIWKANFSAVGYDMKNLVIKEVQTAVSATGDVSDLLMLLADKELFTLAGMSGKTGDLLWHRQLHPNCTAKKQITIDEVVRSALCLNSTDLVGINAKPARRSESLELEISKCEKCSPLIAGIPSSRYTLHRGLKNYLLVAYVNCSGLYTQLKKTHV